MNRFLSDVTNFTGPIQDAVSQFLNTRCDGVSLLHAKQLADALVKIAKASGQVNELVYKIEDK